MSETYTENVTNGTPSRLSGRTTVITGSTRGIGAGIARRFASEGANVIISGRSDAAGEAVAREITKASTPIRSGIPMRTVAGSYEYLVIRFSDAHPRSPLLHRIVI